VYSLKIRTDAHLIQLYFQEKYRQKRQKDSFSVTPPYSNSNCLSSQWQKSKVVLFAFKVNGKMKLL